MTISIGALLVGGAALLLLGYVFGRFAREGRDPMAPPGNVWPPPAVVRPVSPAAAPSGLPQDSQMAVAAALQAGNKIEAIKLYRMATGVDLRAAKDAVEAIEVRG